MADLLAGIPDPTPKRKATDLLGDIPDPPSARASFLNPGKVRITELSTEGQSGLSRLEDDLKAYGVKAGTLTSGRRKPGGAHSHHHEGNAVDFVVPGNMAAVAEHLKSLGYRAQFEKKGQRNPNGSVASGDHIHVTLLGVPQGKAKPRDLLAAIPDPVATPPAPARPTKGGSKGKAAVGDMMGSLLRGEHLKTPKGVADKLTDIPSPTRGRMSLDEASAAAAGMPNTVDPRSMAAGFQAIGKGAEWVGKQAQRPVSAVTTVINEIGRQTRADPLAPLKIWQNPARLSPDTYRQAGRAFATAENPEVTAIRSALGITPENTDPTLYGLVTAGEQLLPFAYDPLNLIPGTGATKAIGKVAAKVGGKALAVSPNARAMSAALAKAKDLEVNVIQPALRHKEEVSGVIREANVNLGKLRKAAVKAGQPDPVTQGGSHPIWDLAKEAVKANTGRYPGKVTLSAADAQRIGAAAQAKGVPAAVAKKTADRLAGIADEVYGSMPAGKMTRDEFIDAFFEVNSRGELAGAAMARQARRKMLFANLKQHASPKPGPGLVQVPITMKKLPDGRFIPEYGDLHGTYLPKATVARLKDVVQETDDAILYHNVVRGAKASYLAQPFTPIKSLVQNAGGVEVALAKEGGSLLDALPHTSSAGKELWKFWTTGELSPMLKEFSDVDPEFLRTLSSVKIADGTAGKMVRIGGKVINLPTGKEGLMQIGRNVLPGSTEHVFIKANGWGDQFGKLVLYKALRARGLDPQAAVKAVKSHLISYGTMPREVGDLVTKLDRNGIVTFANVPAQLAAQTLRTAVTRPDLVARPGQLQDRMLKAFGAEEAYRQDVPEDQKSPFVIPHPTKKGKFVDYSGLSPFGEPLRMAKAGAQFVEDAPSMGVGGALLKTGKTLAFERSVLAPFLAPLNEKTPVILEGAPPDLQGKSYLKHLQDTYNPMGRAAGEFVGVGEGRALTRDAFAPPEDMGDFVARKLGVRPVRTGTRAERRAEGAPAVQARAKVTATEWGRALTAALNLDPTQNPYRTQVARMTPEQASGKARASKKDAIQFLRLGVLVDGKGGLTDEGRYAIQRWALWHAALAKRAASQPKVNY